MTDPDLSLALTDYQAKNSDQALEGALATVRSYCGWHIAPSLSATVNVWSPDGRAVFLRTLDLTAVTSVVQDGATVPSTSYNFESFGVVNLAYGGRFSTLTRVTVAFTHGYAALPDDVRDVVLALAQRSLNDTRGMVPGPGGGAVLMESSTQLTDADKAKLAPFVLSGFA